MSTLKRRIIDLTTKDVSIFKKLCKTKKKSNKKKNNRIHFNIQQN